MSAFPQPPDGAILTAHSLSHIFISGPKIPISTVGLGHRSASKMANSPSPAARLHRPGYPSTALDCTHRGMPYLPLPHFFTSPQSFYHPQDVGVTHQCLGAISSLFSPPHVEMPSVVNWERKLLENLARSVQINPGDCRLLA